MSVTCATIKEQQDTTTKGNKVAHYTIKAQYEYEGTVEADNPEDAEKEFWANLDSFYSSTYDYECVEVRTCSECGHEGEADEFEDEDTCLECAEESDAE
jgi:hypothetical protein